MRYYQSTLDWFTSTQCGYKFHKQFLFIVYDKSTLKYDFSQYYHHGCDSSVTCSCHCSIRMQVEASYKLTELPSLGGKYITFTSLYGY